jgi:hypothetical protein
MRVTQRKIEKSDILGSAECADLFSVEVDDPAVGARPTQVVFNVVVVFPAKARKVTFAVEQWAVASCFVVEVDQVTAAK